jgi:hypothetical protein
VDPEYEFLSSFVFENKDDPLKGQYIIHEEGKGDAFVLIERKLRRKPFSGMKQPTPTGAMLGWEAALSVKKEGSPADGYNWLLYRNGLLIQEGRTDEQGNDSLDIELPDSPYEYKIEIFYRREDSCNNKAEESNEPYRSSNP